MKSRYRFYLPQTHSPTYYNLCRYLQIQDWRQTRFQKRAHFSEQHFQFDEKAAECLEFKHLLAQLVSQYCPQVMPLTYGINDENWLLILHQIKQRNDSKVWILKPALLNNGQHIKIFRTIEDVAQHYSSMNRLGGEHVLQEYLCDPHLLQGPRLGHKYSLRMFVVLTNYAGVFLYPQGYFNVALQPYQKNDIFDLSSHLTNEHLRDDKLNVIQIPTQKYALFKPLYPQIKTIVSATLNGLNAQHPQAFICENKRTLAIFGFDFMVDSDERVWLLEANHGPCFPVSVEHPLQQSLYTDFWQALIANFVSPIAACQPAEEIQYQFFEKIAINC